MTVNVNETWIKRSTTLQEGTRRTAKRMGDFLFENGLRGTISFPTNREKRKAFFPTCTSNSDT